MKIKSLFDNDKTVFSFEVFPPKKDSPIESVFVKLEEICALRPDFISVTYGAGGSGGHSRTVDIASKIKHDFKVAGILIAELGFHQVQTVAHGRVLRQIHGHIFVDIHERNQCAASQSQDDEYD